MNVVVAPLSPSIDLKVPGGISLRNGSVIANVA
jgi:hypothetical protein